MNSVMEFPRILIPPRGRPTWRVPQGLDLQYLGWGKRFYAVAAIPVTRHTGWPYLAILRGTPRLVLQENSLRLRPGDLFVMHPDCPNGWDDDLQAECEILSWIWRTPPGTVVRPSHGKFLIGHCEDDCLDRLRYVHSECRREVALSDPWSTHALQSHRQLLDLLYTRALFQRRQKSNARLQIDLAMEWMRENLATRNAISSLCEYMDTSPSRLYQLFIKTVNESPAECFHRLRMEHGRDLIAEQGFSAKEAAYCLGYLHPNDFCRAFKRYFKTGTRNCHATDKVGENTSPAFQSDH